MQFTAIGALPEMTHQKRVNKCIGKNQLWDSEKCCNSVKKSKRISRRELEQRKSAASFCCSMRRARTVSVVGKGAHCAAMETIEGLPWKSKDLISLYYRALDGQLQFSGIITDIQSCKAADIALHVSQGNLHHKLGEYVLAASVVCFDTITACSHISCFVTAR